MNQFTINRRLPLRGFTLLELQIAIVLLAFGIITLGSLMATQTRLVKRLQTGFKSGSTVYVTRSADPWVRQLGVPARVTSTTINEAAPTPVASPVNTLTIVEQQSDLQAETMIVTVDVQAVN